MKNKILFLDIDGVLNSGDYMHSLAIQRELESKIKGVSFKEHGLHITKTRDAFGQLFDPRCVNWLAYIIAETYQIIIYCL